MQSKRHLMKHNAFIKVSSLPASGFQGCYLNTDHLPYWEKCIQLWMSDSSKDPEHMVST